MSLNQRSVCTGYCCSGTGSGDCRGGFYKGRLELLQWTYWHSCTPWQDGDISGKVFVRKGKMLPDSEEREEKVWETALQAPRLEQQEGKRYPRCLSRDSLEGLQIVERSTLEQGNSVRRKKQQRGALMDWLHILPLRILLHHLGREVEESGKKDWTWP